MENHDRYLYDKGHLLSSISNARLFDEFCKIFYEVNRDDGRLQPILNQTVDHFNQIEDDKKKEEFKSHIKAFMKLYSYVSQIMTFTDVDIEKLFIFLRFLNKKLPKKESEQLDISDSAKEKLIKLTPKTYIGLSNKL